MGFVFLDSHFAFCLAEMCLLSSPLLILLSFVGSSDGSCRMSGALRLGNGVVRASANSA